MDTTAMHALLLIMVATFGVGFMVIYSGQQEPEATSTTLTAWTSTNVLQTTTTLTETLTISDVPYSYLSIHSEAPESFEWLEDIVDMANRYNTPLTIMMHPQMVNSILKDRSKMDLVHNWQARGHEIGLHNQGCYGEEGKDSFNGAFLSADDAKNFERLAAPYEIKSGAGPCRKYLPESFEYLQVGRFDGRSSIALRYTLPGGNKIYELHAKAGYGMEELSIKKAQYNTMLPDEIYNFNFHGERELEAYEEWLKFLYEKDPSGGKRKTMSQLVEEVIIPEGKYINESELFNSKNERIRECSQLIGDKVYEDTFWYSNSDIYNFGRCVNSKTYCISEQACTSDGFYIPTECRVERRPGVRGYMPASEICPVECGDGKCSRGEDRMMFPNTPIACDSDCGRQPSGMPLDFEFNYSWGVLGRNNLDTRKNLYVKDMICEPAINYTVRLSKEEKYAVYNAIVKNDFFGLKENMVSSFASCEPPSDIDLSITADRKTKAVMWRCGYPMKDANYQKLRNITEKINEIISQREEELNITQPRCGYL